MYKLFYSVETACQCEIIRRVWQRLSTGFD